MLTAHPTQARTVAEPIIATVALMAQSGLPCYSRGAPVDNLRQRFHLEMSEKQVGGTGSGRLLQPIGALCRCNGEQ